LIGCNASAASIASPIASAISNTNGFRWRRLKAFIEPAPAYISTCYVERQNLALRMTQKRFARLTNGFLKEAHQSRCGGQPVRLPPQPLPGS
jgi:hypothetical protein